MAKTKGDDDDGGGGDGGSKGGPNSLKAIAYIKAELKKKLEVTDMYLSYVEDSKKLIEE